MNSTEYIISLKIKNIAGIEIITNLTVDSKVFDITIPTLSENKFTNNVLV